MSSAAVRSQTLRVLLVEDDPGDALLIQEVFAEHADTAQLWTVTDGAQALDFLHARGPHADAPRPDLVLLDLNLPKRSGHEVLAEIRADEMLSRIPVVVLTTSGAEEDVHRAYAAYANAYVTKPIDWDQFTATVRHIENFFAHVVRLPNH